MGGSTESLESRLAASATSEAALSRVTSTTKSCHRPKSRSSRQLPRRPWPGAPPAPGEGSRYLRSCPTSATGGAPRHSGSGGDPPPAVPESTSWAIRGRRRPFRRPRLSLTTSREAGLGDGAEVREGRKSTPPFAAQITNISRR